MIGEDYFFASSFFSFIKNLLIILYLIIKMNCKIS